MSTPLQPGNPVDPRLPWIRKLHHMDAAWATSLAGERASAVEAAGRKLGDALREGPTVRSVHSIDGQITPYPIRFAYNGAIGGNLLFMQNRALLVQVEHAGRLYNVLFNPTDPVASAEAPYFRRLRATLPDALYKLLGPKPSKIPAALAQWGLRCEDIDVVCFDHFHVQDLRPIIGTADTPGTYPNALLLAPKVEWEDWDHLHPLQRAFFIDEGKAGLDPQRVVLTENDLLLGPGAVLLRTPGHTSGNQTIFLHTDTGVWGSSENGTSADCWTPQASRLKALRKTAHYYGADVILNTNTPELFGEQYISMLLERAVVDRVASAPDFVQMLPSSEVTWHVAAPHIRPSMVHGGLAHGRVAAREPAAATAAAA